MKNNFLNSTLQNIYLKPSIKSEVISQILYGESFKILLKKKDWIKIKTNFDKYIGFIKDSKFKKNFEPSKKIYKTKSRIFVRKNKKFLPTNDYLYFGSGLENINQEKKFVEFEKNKWIKRKDLKRIDHIEKNFIKVFKLFLNSKYLWGGKTTKGIDCSTLIQIFFYYNRNFFPRDTIDQIKYCKKKNR